MNDILKKMRIKAPHLLYFYNAPKDFPMLKSKLPEGIHVTTDAKNKYNTLHWFVRNKAEVDTQAAKIMKLLKPGLQVWCYYPKRTSGIQTDLTRDKGWETLLSEQGLHWISLISVDETWSAFAFRLKTAADLARDSEPKKEREIFSYADPKTKTITLPPDLEKAFGKNKKARAAFETLSFSHRKEYVEWVITAKREETRSKRVAGTMSLLLEGKKNPH